MFEYVLLVSFIGDLHIEHEVYAGNFNSCTAAVEWAENEYSMKDNWTGYRCLHEDYLYLPENFELVRTIK